MFFRPAKTSTKIIQNFSRNFGASAPKNARVTLLGCYSSPVGQTLAMLLKQNPLITALKLYDDVAVPAGVGTALDLSHIDSSAQVSYYSTPKDLRRAMSHTDILIVNNLPGVKSGESVIDFLKRIDPQVDEIVTNLHHTDNHPIIVVNSEPVDAVTPLFAKHIYMEKIFDPKKIMGVSSTLDVLANRFYNRQFKLPNGSASLRHYGGNLPDSFYLCRSKDFPEEKVTEQMEYTLRTVEQSVVDFLLANPYFESTPNLKAYAAHRFVSNLAESFLKRRMVIESACVFNERLYFTYPVVLGREGVEQIILDKALETNLFYERLYNHFGLMDEIDEVVKLLSAEPLTRVNSENYTVDQFQ